MKSGQYTAEQIIKILNQAEKDEQTIAAICREHGIVDAATRTNNATVQVT